MDWKQLLAKLADAGLTQMQIAERCGVSQSTISDLARGATKSPSFELGSRLQRLADETPARENPPSTGALAGAAAGQGA